MDRLTDSGVDFKSFEQWCYDMGMAFARMLMSIILVNLDNRILKERDRNVYRAKDLRPLTIKTLMGEVTIKRRVYRMKNEEGKNEYVHLLDQAIGLELIGKCSINLVHRMAEVIADCSYRAAAETVSFLSGQKISHGGLWNAVQTIGERISDMDEGRARLAKNFHFNGKKIVNMLQEEFDGVWVNMQGKDRPKTGHKREMKLAMAYEGVICEGVTKSGKPINTLVNPLYMAGFETPEAFFRKKEGQLGAVYNLDEIEVRLIGGDGGGWIEGFGAQCGCEHHFQLDRFHIERELIRSGVSKENRKRITECFDEKRTLEGLAYVKLLWEAEANEKKKEKLGKTFGYLNNHRDNLTPILKRGLALPQPNDGVLCGNMGAMESTVCGVIALRMKKRRASFSKIGGTNLARLLCLKRSKKLDETMADLSGMKLPVTLEEAVTMALSAAKAPKKDGKGFQYPTTGGLPFTSAAATNGRDAIKGLCSYRPLTDLVLR